jgi:hypothetical protein
MNKISKIKNIYFALTLISSLLSLCALIIVLLLDFGDLQLLYLFLVLIVGLLLMNKFRYHLDQTIYIEQYQKLLKNTIKPFEIEIELLSKKWINNLLLDGFVKIKEFNDISYYYSIKQLSEKNKHTSILVLFILIHSSNLNYDSTLIINQINQLEDDIRLNKKYRQRIFVHVKAFDEITDEKLKETEQVFWIRKGNEHIVSLYLSYFKIQNSVYFVENPTYSPNRYYSYGVDLIKEIIK